MQNVYPEFYPLLLQNRPSVPAFPADMYVDFALGPPQNGYDVF